MSVRLWYRHNKLTYFFELFTDHCEGFEDGVRRTCDGHYPLWTRRVGNVNFGTALENRKIQLQFTKFKNLNVKLFVR